jgi:hypothetical protein
MRGSINEPQCGDVVRGVAAGYDCLLLVVAASSCYLLLAVIET